MLSCACFCSYRWNTLNSFIRSFVLSFIHSSIHFDIYLFVCLLLYVRQVKVSCGPGGQLSLLFRSFSNPSSQTLSGACCDPLCEACNYYFVFCIRVDPRSSSCLVSGKTSTYHNYKHLVFKDGESLGNGWKNPLSGSFASWKVR